MMWALSEGVNERECELAKAAARMTLRRVALSPRQHRVRVTPFPRLIYWS